MFFFLEIIADVKELSLQTLKKSSKLNHNESNFIASGQNKIQETNKASMSQPTEEVCCGKNIIWILDMTKFNNACRLEAAIGYIDCLVNKKTEIWLQPNNLNSEGGLC